MKSILQKNIKKEAKDLIGIQYLVKQYDQENKKLNRQVLKLMQENTRLKMDKIQNNIVSLMPSSNCKKTVQKICSMHIQQYKQHGMMKCQEKEKIFGEVNRFKCGRISISSSKIRPKDKENIKQYENAKANEPTPFFTFGTVNTCDNLLQDQEKDKVIKLISGQSHSKIAYQDDANFLETFKPTSTTIKSNNNANALSTPLKQQHIKRNGSLRKGRTVHSILPSPQITPQRSQNNLISTPDKNFKPINDHHQQLNQNARPLQSSETRKKYIQVVSHFLTPSKSSKTMKQPSKI